MKFGQKGNENCRKEKEAYDKINHCPTVYGDEMIEGERNVSSSKEWQ